MKVIITTFCIMSLISCSSANSARHDGLVLTDTNTGRRYMLEHRVGALYAIREQQTVIIGTDTTKVFK